SRSKADQVHSGLKAGLSVVKQRQNLKRGTIPCRSWLAGDGINWMYLMHRVACIAGKPAPTEKQLLPLLHHTQVGFQAAVLLICF
ncbi:hypothetical protein HX875_28380, partial [Pseudomonas yamanorum]|nr:hypothetical protein [Pseudomonas yamanorum]